MGCKLMVVELSDGCMGGCIFLFLPLSCAFKTLRGKKKLEKKSKIN